MLRRMECRSNFKNRPVRTQDIKGGPKQPPPPQPLIGIARSLPLIGLTISSGNLLTLAGTVNFASFHGTGGGLVRPPCRFAPNWVRAPRKNERVARRETKQLVYKLKALGQPVTTEVRSSVEKWRKHVIVDTFASDGARAKFKRPACSSVTSRTRFDGGLMHTDEF